MTAMPPNRHCRAANNATPSTANCGFTGAARTTVIATQTAPPSAQRHQKTQCDRHHKPGCVASVHIHPRRTLQRAARHEDHYPCSSPSNASSRVDDVPGSLGNRTNALVSVLGTGAEFPSPHTGARPPQRSQVSSDHLPREGLRLVDVYIEEHQPLCITRGDKSTAPKGPHNKSIGLNSRVAGLGAPAPRLFRTHPRRMQ